jgi:alanyl-tRNA synthetase
VRAIVLDGTQSVASVSADEVSGRRVEVVLSQTPFYAEGGGQVGDRGEIVWEKGRFVVEDTQAVGDGKTMRNHTATHILHASLRKVLGTHVRQAGSLVAPDHLRFDFTHLEALTPEELRAVEALANEAVRENMPVHIEHERRNTPRRCALSAFARWTASNRSRSTASARSCAAVRTSTPRAMWARS